MGLVTDLTPEELVELQAQMGDPQNVDRLHKKFTKAVQPAKPLCKIPPRALLPEQLMDQPTGYWNPKASDEEWDHHDGTRVVPVGEGGLVEVYHCIPNRFEEAKSCQPEPGKKPQGEWNGDPPTFGSPTLLGTILRKADGSLVHMVKNDGELYVLRQLTDSPITDEQ